MRLRGLFTLSVCTSITLLGACGDGSVGGDGETVGEVGGSLDGGEVGSGDGDGGTTGAPPPTGDAKGLTVVGVSANQGTAVPIASGTSWVPSGSRNARLAGKRDTMLRAYFNVDDGWIPRDIECRLALESPGGEVSTLVTTMPGVSGSSNTDQLASTCNFFLDAEAGQTESGTRFQVSFHEVSEGAGEGLAQNATVVPADGRQDIGFEPGDMVMKVKLVPILYQGMTAPLDANLDLLRDAMFQQNPLSQIQVTIREPVPSSSGDLYQLLQLMETTKAQDGAPNNEYYFAFVNTGQQFGAIGLAPLGGTVAAGLWLNSPQLNSETFVHEVGHDQSLGHVECPDFGMPPFETYPYPNGFIGNTGYGIINNQIYSAFSNYNYMTYCGQNGGQWVSDWNWERTWDRIAQFTAQGDEVGSVPVLRGMVGGTDDGQSFEHWWTTTGVVDAERLSANQTFRFEAPGQESVEVLGELRPMSDGTTLWMTVPLPEGFDPLSGSITRVSPAGESAVALAAEHVVHHLAAQ